MSVCEAEAVLARIRMQPNGDLELQKHLTAVLRARLNEVKAGERGAIARADKAEAALHKAKVTIAEMNAQAEAKAGEAAAFLTLVQGEVRGLSTFIADNVSPVLVKRNGKYRARQLFGRLIDLLRIVGVKEADVPMLENMDQATTPASRTRKRRKASRK